MNVTLTHDQREKIIELFKDKTVTLKKTPEVSNIFQGKTGNVIGYEYSQNKDQSWNLLLTARFDGISFFATKVNLELIDSLELEKILNPPPPPQVKADDGPGLGVMIGSAALAASLLALVKKAAKKTTPKTVQETQKVKVEEEAFIKV